MKDQEKPEVVSASPAQQFRHNHSAGSDYCPACTAAQPDPPRIGKWIEFLRKCSAEAHLANTTITFAHDVFDGLLAELAGLANPPKVEEVAKQIAMECYDSMVLSPAQEIKIKDIAESILGPFFTQVSQPPSDFAQKASIAITKMVDMWLLKMNLPTSNKEGRQIFTQTVQDIIEACASPATPVSANGTEPHIAELEALLRDEIGWYAQIDLVCQKGLMERCQCAKCRRERIESALGAQPTPKEGAKK